MRYIKFTNQNFARPPENLRQLVFAAEKKIAATKIPIPAKIAAGIVLFFSILLFFIFGGTNTFFFEKGGFNRTSGRTNILLLGTGGEGHAGANLSDTIIVASVNLAKKDVVLVSIPRDLWLPSLGVKVNAVYSVGEEKRKGTGLDFAKDVVEDIVGVPIHYAARVDFAGFVAAVDLVGGLEIDVKRGFDDYKYPVAGREDDTCGFTFSEIEVNSIKQLQILTATGSAAVTEDPFTCRYQQVHFNQGLQKMDGETALKFVRSRMGTAGAGSDFDRSERQKQVIVAFVKEVFDLQTFFSPKKLTELAATFDKHIDTDFSQKEFGKIPAVLSQFAQFSFRNLALSSQGEAPLLYNPPVSQFGAWVLLPKDNNWESLTKTVKDFIFSEVKTS